MASEVEQKIPVHWKGEDNEGGDLVLNEKETSTFDFDPTGKDWRAFCLEVRSAFSLGRMEFEIVDPSDNFKMIASDFLTDKAKRPSRLVVQEKGKRKCPVTFKFVPRQGTGALRAKASMLEYPNVFEELFENSVEAIRLQQKKDQEGGKEQLTAGHIAVDFDQTSKEIRFWDNGIGMDAKRLQEIFGLGSSSGRENDHSEEESASAFEQMLGGRFGDFGMGMKSVYKFGEANKEVTLTLQSKTEESEGMLLVHQDFKSMEREDLYNSLVQLRPEPASKESSPFLGTHGTVLYINKVDAKCFEQLFEKPKRHAFAVPVNRHNATFTLKKDFLRRLAAKFHLYVESKATEFLRTAFSGISSLDWAKPAITITVNKISLENVPNTVQERLLALLCDPPKGDGAHYPSECAASDSVPDPGERTGRSSTNNSSSRFNFKPMWHRHYQVSESSEGKKGKVMVLLYYNSQEDEQMEEDKAKAMQRKDSRLLVFWNGLYLEKEDLGDLNTLPFIHAAREACSAPLKRAVDRVRGFVFVGGEFRANTNKTRLNHDLALTRELLFMSASENNRLKHELRKNVVDVIERWNKDDNKEDYQGEKYFESDPEEKIFYPRVVVKKSEAPGSRSQFRASRTHEITFYARRKRPFAQENERASFVEVKLHSKTTIYGTVDLLYKKSEESATGYAVIDVFYQEKRSVETRFITRTLSPNERKTFEAKVERCMPDRLKVWVLIPKALARDCSQTIEQGVEDVFKKFQLETDEAVYCDIDTLPGSGPKQSRKEPCWRMHADQADQFQVMVEVCDQDDKVIQHCRTEGHTNAKKTPAVTVINLKTLKCCFTMSNADGKPLRHNNQDSDWVETTKVYKEGEGARYFSSKTPMHYENLIKDFLCHSGSYKLHIHISFDDQRPSVSRHLESKFSKEVPPGLAKTIQLEVTHGAPQTLRVEMEPRTWLGEARTLKSLQLLDRYNNIVSPTVITDIKCNVPDHDGLEPQVVRKRTKSVHKVTHEVTLHCRDDAPIGDEVKLDFVVEVKWEDTQSSAVRLLTSRQSTNLRRAASMQPLREQVKTTVMSGLPQHLKIHDQPFDAPLQPGQPLECTISVLDAWGNRFLGFPGEVSFELNLRWTEHVVRARTGEDELSTEILTDREPVRLPDQLKAVVQGQYGTKATLTFGCNIHDQREGAQKHPTIKKITEISVQEARLVWVPGVVPDGLQSDIEAVRVQSADAAKLQRCRLQLQDNTGKLLKVSDRGGLRVRRTLPGSPDEGGEDSDLTRTVTLELADGVSEPLGQLMSITTSHDYHAKYNGVNGPNCKLCVCLQPGAARRIEILPRTKDKAFVGTRWEVYFQVTDEDGVLLVNPGAFSLSFKCKKAERLRFDCDRDSVQYDSDAQAFKAVAVPTGCPPQTLSVVTVKLLLRAKKSETESEDVSRESTQNCTSPSAEVQIRVNGGRASRLAFTQAGVMQTNFHYMSNEALKLGVQALDEYGNEDRICQGQVRITMRWVGMAQEEELKLSAEMSEGTAELNIENWLKVRTARVEINAVLVPETSQIEQHKGKQKRRRTATEQQLQVGLEDEIYGTCSLTVTMGIMAKRIEVIHDDWESTTSCLTMGDKKRDLIGLKASVIADDESKIPNAQLELQIGSGKEQHLYLSEPSVEDCCVQTFRPCRVPRPAGTYQKLIVLTVKELYPKIRKVVTFIRTEGTPASLILKVSTDKDGRDEVDKITICADGSDAGSDFYVGVEVRNRLHVPVSFNPRSVQFEILEQPPGLKFEIWEQPPGLKYGSSPQGWQLRCQRTFPDKHEKRIRVRIKILESQDGVGQGGDLLVIASHGSFVDSPRRLKSAPMCIHYISSSQMQENQSKLSKIVEEKNQIEQQLNILRREQQDLHEKKKVISQLQHSMEDLGGASELEDALAQAQAELDNKKPKRMTTAVDLQLHQSKSLEQFLQCRQHGKLPTNIDFMGVVGELGRVDAGTDSASNLVANGISVLGGQMLKAVVVDTNKDADAIANHPSFKGLRTLSMCNPHPPKLDGNGLVVFPERPPEGARYAVNAVCCSLEHDVDAACCFPAEHMKRLRADVWWPVLGSALIFESEEAMELYKGERCGGRKLKMAAETSDGTWRVLDGQYSFPETPCVALRRTTTAPEPEECSELTRKVQAITSQLRERKKMEEQRAEMLADRPPDSYVCSLDTEEKALQEKLQELDAERASLVQAASSACGKRKAAQAPSTSEEESTAEPARKTRAAVAATTETKSRASS